jgi:uncharacterized protein YndB with AHSA1/START domain
MNVQSVRVLTRTALHQACQRRDTSLRVTFSMRSRKEAIAMRSIWHEVWIEAASENVFEALTTKAGLDGWWGPAVTVGSTIGSVVEFDHGLGAPLRMEISALVPNETVEWKCVSPFDDPSNPASEWFGQTLRFDLAPRRDATILGATQNVTVMTFHNTGWPDESRWCGFCNAAWGMTLSVNLKNHCETNAASPTA